MRVFIVDDEAPARRKIVRFLRHESEVVVAGEAANGLDAVEAVLRIKPDLIFLDVQMPGMDGFEVARALESSVSPRIVFVTAHDQYAIQAFDVHAFGYLLKPFDEARFAKVLADAKKHFAKDTAAEASAGLQRLLAAVERGRQRPVRLLIQEDGRAFFLAVEKIDWAEAEKNYLKIHSGTQTYSARGTLEALEEKLDPAHFLRINRSCLVRIDFIRELQSWSHGEYKVMLQSGITQTWTRRYLNRHPELWQKL